MTKDDIIRGKIGLIPFVDKIANTEFGEGLHRAMDEFAKQQAIAFDVWKRMNLYTLDYPNSRYIKLIVSGDKARTEMVPVDDVYAQFIEQQNK